MAAVVAACCARRCAAVVVGKAGYGRPSLFVSNRPTSRLSGGCGRGIRRGSVRGRARARGQAPMPVAALTSSGRIVVPALRAASHGAERGSTAPMRTSSSVRQGGWS